MPEVLSPTDWGARVDYDTWTDPYTPDEGVVIHHGGGGDYPAAQHPFSRDKEMSQLRSWEAFHIDGRGWRGLAYGWGIGQTGTIYRIRGWNRYGAHLGDIDGDGIANNEELIPIIWILSGLIHRSSQAMQDSTAWLRGNVIEPKAPKARQLYGHREVQDKPTICPGPLSMVYVESHRFLDTPPIGEDVMLPLNLGDDSEDVRLAKDRINLAYGTKLDLQSTVYNEPLKAAAATHLGKYTGEGAGKTGDKINAKMWNGLLKDFTAKFGSGVGGVTEARVNELIAASSIVPRG